MRILIVDDHALMRHGMALVVESAFPGVDVVGAGTVAAALDVMREGVADLALIDVRLAGLDGLELLRALKIEWPDVPVIMLSTHENAPYVKRALSDGAAGYLLKDATPEDLALAIEGAIRGGGSVLSHQAIQVLFEDLARSTGTPGAAAPDASGHHLTPREHEILALLSEGRSNRSIAQNLYVSDVTVKAHLAAIFRKLAVTNRTQAAMMAVQLGIGRSPGTVPEHAGTGDVEPQPPGDATSR